MSRQRWSIAVIVSVLLLLAPAIRTRPFCDLSKATCTTKSDAHAAIGLMKDWGVWLTGIQTGAIAALALLVRRRAASGAAAIVAVVLFGSSIVADTALLAGLPSISLRLSAPVAAPSCAACTKCDECPSLPPAKPGEAATDQPSRLNDIYEMKLFDFVPFRLGFAYMLSHWYFILGMVAFGTTFALDISRAPRAGGRLVPVAIVGSSLSKTLGARAKLRNNIGSGSRDEHSPNKKRR